MLGWFSCCTCRSAVVQMKDLFCPMRADSGDEDDSSLLHHREASQAAAVLPVGPPSAALLGTGATIRSRLRFQQPVDAEMAGMD